MGWVLVDRREGRCVVHSDTYADTFREAWVKSFWQVSAELGDDWMRRYWKRWEQSLRSARKHKLTIERAEVTLL